MSISKKFYNSFTELKSVKSLAMIAMLLALRIILGFIGNSTLPFFGNNVKLSGAFFADSNYRLDVWPCTCYDCRYAW